MLKFNKILITYRKAYVAQNTYSILLQIFHAE